LNNIRLHPDDQRSRLAITALFIEEGRITGDHLYYDMAAMRYVNEVLKTDSNNFEGLLYKALLLLSQHHFDQALVLADKARELIPYNAFVYGILVDCNIEMGNYSKAVEYSDKMVSIRPDIRSYARISYLREIHGDYPGAIEAMKLAIGAGVPGDESSEWARIQLGKLYEHIGELDKATFQYQVALEQRPNYAYALAGLARIETTEKKYDEAIAHLVKAEKQVMDYSFRQALAEVYEEKGDHESAIKTIDQLIDDMKREVELGMKNENVGHYADQELAHAYIIKKDLDKALQHAIAEYNRRPDNIDVNETLAWVYYLRKEYPEAKNYIEVTLKTGSKNPSLMCKAGLIFSKSGNKSVATKYFKQAFSAKPNIPSQLKGEASHEMEIK
jgi:tetratricopeptide (TPR) repeat protein